MACHGHNIKLTESVVMLRCINIRKFESKQPYQLAYLCNVIDFVSTDLAGQIAEITPIGIDKSN